MRRHLHPLRIADVVESERVADLCVQHCDGVASGRKRAGASRHPGFPRELRRQIGRYEFDGWRNTVVCRHSVVFVFHTLPSDWYNPSRRAAFFSQIPSALVGCY